MTMYPSSSTQQPAAICALKSPADAIHILEAVRLGLVPRVTRRLTGHERSMIRPGTVWVWEEEETNMRRWTDGRRWGASRVGGGGFLVYTESSDSLSPPPSRPDSPTYNQYYGNGRESSTSTPPRRPEPLVKQTYSTSMTHPVTGKIKKFHVVAYSSKRNPQGDGANPLPLPHQLPNLANIKITPGIWPDWETRRDDYNSRRSAAPHGSHGPPPSHLPHAPPHHIPAGPGTPVTATAAPYPPPPDMYRPPSPSYHAMPPTADGRPPPPDAPPPHDRRYPPYPPYDPYDRPPYPYDMYPPPPDRYYDRYHPYYHPRDFPPHIPPPDYRYDDRYYDRERRPPPPPPPPGDERDPRGEPRDPRDPVDPADPREPPRDPRDPREPAPRPDDREMAARYYPPPPPPHGYYRDPRMMRDPRDYPPPPPRDPRDPRVPMSPADRDPRDLRDPRDPRDYYPPPREGSYPAGPPRPSSSHLGKRTPESRPADELPADKRPTWSPRGQGENGAPPGHARSTSIASYADREREPRPEAREGAGSREGTERAASRGRSRSPARTYSSAGANGANGNASNGSKHSREGEENGARGAERDSRDATWGRVPA